MKYSIFIVLAGAMTVMAPAKAETAATTATSSANALDIKGGELLGRPPSDPPGMVRPKLTPENVQEAVNQEVAATFKAAAGPSNNLLTAKQAKAAGWGFISDNFEQIDKDRDGFVRLDDVASFMEARSPIQQSPSEKSDKVFVPHGPIQIIE
ncbi:hypothetical protein [Phyllobacterium sp. SB3]|uniref:hypothetical protein n=1 Tax=Phyllobacterium sp. SB3 TaxID=3156073 RepID=UPI0032AF94B0